MTGKRKNGIAFTKMHGTGNDYVYIDCFREFIPHPAELSRRVSDRHKGIGSDGLVLIMPSETSDFRMRMFNPDGSEAEMCGNASRCVGKYVYDKGLTDKTSIALETKAGVRRLQLFPVDGKVERVRVDMGEPALSPQSIPVEIDADRVVGRRIRFGEEEYAVTCVSMGNPHTVIFLAKESDLDAFPLEDIGKRIERSPLFPQRTNVEFVQALSPGHARMRVWERGAGETQACGTGACAVLAAGALNGILNAQALVSLPGGDLEIEWNAADNHIYMTGDAVTVYEGELLM